jgi:D-psicose/D-tagatose/L-ribulose 3-epimerase
MKIALCNEVLQPMPFAQQCALAWSLGYDSAGGRAVHAGRATRWRSPMRRPRPSAARPKTPAWPSAACTGCWWHRPGCRSSALTQRLRDRTTAVMERLVELCALMGGRYLVHGSPKQRSVPAGATAAVALDRARGCLARAARRAEACGVTYCIEPLSTRETDLINTVAQAVALVEQVGSPAFKTMIDCSAAGQVEAEPVAALMARWMPTGHIAHVQVNDPNRRGPGQGEMAFGPILSTLKRRCRPRGTTAASSRSSPSTTCPTAWARPRAPSAT